MAMEKSSMVDGNGAKVFDSWDMQATPNLSLPDIGRCNPITDPKGCQQFLSTEESVFLYWNTKEGARRDTLPILQRIARLSFTLPKVGALYLSGCSGWDFRDKIN